ncbi:MAG: hypothetical protein WCC90_20940, partial [Methylocella sp.]
VLVPTAAIQRNAQGAFVYVIGSDNTATLHTVTVGTTDGNTAAVQNINAGDVIAVNGFDKLQNGAKVTIGNTSGNGGNNGASGTPTSGANKNSPATASTNPTGKSGGTHQ